MTRLVFDADPDGRNPRVVGIETPIGVLGDAHMDALAAVYYGRGARTRDPLVVSGLLGNLERVGLVRDRRTGLRPAKVLTVRDVVLTPLGAAVARTLS